MSYRAGLIIVAVMSFAFAARAIAEESGEKLAVVNVSFVFEKYTKVPDIQRRIDAKYQVQKDELQKRATELAKRNKELEQFYNQANSTEAVFDAIQKLRKDQYYFERDLNQLNADIQLDYTRDMRSVLTDIRSAVRIVAESEKFQMVLRSPDTDDPQVVERDPKTPPNPAEGDNKTVLELNAPQSVAQLVERFNRNPVLFGAKTVDLTQMILKKLNDDYSKHSNGDAKK